MGRAVAHGLSPTRNAITATLARNAERTVNRTLAAQRVYRAGERADLMGVRGAALASAAAIRAKKFSATVANRVTIAPAPVTLVMNQRAIGAALLQYYLATGRRIAI